MRKGETRGIETGRGAERVADLLHRPENSAARASARSVSYLAEQMSRWGYDAEQPIIVEADGRTIIDGRHRALAAQQAGIRAVPTLVCRSDWRRLLSEAGSWTRMVECIRRAAGIVDFVLGMAP